MSCADDNIAHFTKITLTSFSQTLLDVIDISAIAIDQWFSRPREHNVAVQLHDAKSVAAANQNRTLSLRLYRSGFPP